MLQLRPSSGGFALAATGHAAEDFEETGARDALALEEREKLGVLRYSNPARGEAEGRFSMRRWR